jgi:maltose-binding protein MalE
MRSAYSFGILWLLIACVLSGCRPPVDDARRILIWHQKTGPERDLFHEIVERYNAQNPDCVIETLYRENEELRNLYVIAAVAGQGPDLVYGPADNVGVLVTTETIRPLEQVLDSAFFDSFIPEGVVEWKGSRWLVADQIGNHLALVYNKSLVPQPPGTLEELIAVGKSLTEDTNGDGKVDRYGLTWNYREPFFFVPFLTGFGGWIMDELGNPTLDNDATVRALQFVLDLRDKHKVIPKEGDYDIADMLFKEERTAMIINGPWSWGSYGIPERSLIAPLPKNTTTGLWCAPMYSAKGYSVNVNVPADKLPAIRKAVMYLTSPAIQAEMAQKLATSPVSREVVDSPTVQANPVLQASMEQIRRCKPMPIRPQMRQIWDGMRGPYQLIMNGAVTAQEGARLMQRECEKNIADSQL